jgi:hypothetical protein
MATRTGLCQDGKTKRDISIWHDDKDKDWLWISVDSHNGQPGSGYLIKLPKADFASLVAEAQKDCSFCTPPATKIITFSDWFNACNPSAPDEEIYRLMEEGKLIVEKGGKRFKPANKTGLGWKLEPLS